MREKSLIKHQDIGRTLSVAITCLKKNADRFSFVVSSKHISHHLSKMISAKRNFIVSLTVLFFTSAVASNNAQLQFIEVANDNWQPECKNLHFFNLLVNSILHSEVNGCNLIGYTREVSIPGCVDFTITTNGCRGFCESFAVSSNLATGIHSSKPVFYSQLLMALNY